MQASMAAKIVVMGVHFLGCGDVWGTGWSGGGNGGRGGCPGPASETSLRLNVYSQLRLNDVSEAAARNLLCSCAYSVVSMVSWGDTAVSDRVLSCLDCALVV